jgi:hypothetical protein
LKKYLLTVFTFSVVTWVCFALSIVVVRGEIASSIASGEGIKAVRLNTLNSVIDGLAAEEQQSILRREGFSSLPLLQKQLAEARVKAIAAMRDQAHLRLVTSRIFIALQFLSFLATLAACVPSLWRLLAKNVGKPKLAH